MMARIPTRSQRQAMDWSLALISQGIESTIDHDVESGWALLIPEADYLRATETVKQYQRENRHWPWRQALRHDLLFDWGALGWVLLTALFFWAQAQAPIDIETPGLMDASLVSRGEWWRLITALFLHADIAHLAMNLSLGLLLLGLVMGRFGTGLGLMAALLAGAGGNVLTWSLLSSHRSLGASGMVMGCVGLLAAQAFHRHRQSWKLAISGLGAGLLLFILVGVSPNPRTDVLAHLGGFLTGIALGALLVVLRAPAQNRRLNLLAAAAFAACTIGTWWLALRP